MSPRFCQTLVVDMDVPDEHAHRGAARRRRERRLRAFLRHEKLSLSVQMATISHHSLHRNGRADAFTQTITFEAPVDDHITPDPAVSTASAPPPAATRAATSAPSPVFEYVAQAPDVTYAAPARMAPVIKKMASPRLAPSFCGLVNQKFSSGTTCMEVSAPESTRSILELPSGLEQVRVQEMPEINSRANPGADRA